MSAQPPLRLSSPLYDWDQSATDEHVSVDQLHQRIIHRQKGGFFAIDIAEEGDTPDGRFIKLETEDLRQVRFSPDGLYFAFLAEKRLMGCIETLHPTREPISLTSRAMTRPDLEVLSFFWLPAPPGIAPADHADLAVVSTQGVEMFRVHFDQNSAKSVKVFPVPVRMCWVEPLSGMVLICTGPRTLQPFDLRAKVPQKLPKFDLVIGKVKAIEAHDVAVMTIYEATFCIHMDSTNGRVSLRNISNPLQGTPDHDVVIDVAVEGGVPWSPGALRLSKVDNLLIVHCVDKMVSLVFDIRHSEKSTVPSICGSSPVSPAGTSGGGLEQTPSWQDWDYVGGSTILDLASGHVHRLQIDMEAVLESFVPQADHDLATVMRLLLRRTSCCEHIVRMLRRALLSKASFGDLSQGFAMVNHAYRQTIEAVSLSQQGGAAPSRQATVSLQKLESAIGHQSILSEKDMVSEVFYPHFMETTHRVQQPLSTAASQSHPQAVPPTPDRSKCSGRGLPSAPLASDIWRIPLPPLEPHVPAEGACESRPVRSPYIVSVVIVYLRSLLSMQILPHKILQCFVFDICMYCRQEHTLQQLLHYHVLLDSSELVHRLREVAYTRSCVWATQACLDMALRLQEHSVVADMLLHTRQYLDIVPFLINQQCGSFKLHRILEQIDGDEQAREEDPDLLEHVVGEVRGWLKEASSGGGQVSSGVVPPDITGCERWLAAARPSTLSVGGNGYPEPLPAAA